MNDEIKEILEEFLKEKGAYSLRYSFNGDLAYSQEQILKDYITNLQNELKYQKEMEDEYIKKHTKLLQDFTNLQEENEDLKDRLKVMEHFKNSLLEENEDYKSRCDKIKNYLKQVHYEQQHGILSSNNLIYGNIIRLCDGEELIKSVD